MAERSFAKEVEKLRLGAGETFTGEGILAITKALLENGVGYVGGYQGSPISHLMDVLADAQDILGELGVRFEASASEATATAMLAASVHYPIRGAATYKSVVGTNVASDALSNLASGGVTGGALIIVGEDYGEGSSIMQERTYAFAMKSQVWMLDPRPNLPSIVKSVGDGFRLSEASNTPVMLQVRIRSCHVHGHFEASDNVAPPLTVAEALESPRRDLNRIVLPPASFLHEKEKLATRWPAAERFIAEEGINERLGARDARVGLVVQGGNYNTVIRALNRLGLADIYGDTDAVDILCLNAIYPLVPVEILDFCEGKDAVMVVEEGQPNFMEQAIGHMLYQAGRHVKLEGKGMLPDGGELTGQVVLDGLGAFLTTHAPGALPPAKVAANEPEIAVPDLSDVLPGRPPGFCTGCPERPIFAATKLVQEELGEHHIASDIGCHLFSIMPPFDLGATTMGYGLGPASASALQGPEGGRKSISFVGDGGFWHNGVASSIGNAVFNRSDGVIVIVDNHYSAATGGQDILSSRAANRSKDTNHPIAKAVRGMGVEWVREIDRTYDVGKVQATLKEALQSPEPGPKVIVASSECMLNKQRRIKPELLKLEREGRRVERPRFGVDEDVCTGDHACMRLSGCPSLTVKDTGDPLRDDPVAAIDETCVGCGNCGEVAHAAVLCPSFYEARVVTNPTPRETRRARRASRVMGWLQRRRSARRIELA